MLSIQQLEELKKIIDFHNVRFIAKQLGPNYLTNTDKATLKRAGIDPKTAYSLSGDVLTNSFYFGLISDAIQADARNVTFDNLKQYLKSGNFIPLNGRERAVLDSVKRQSLRDIRGMGDQIFADINRVVDQTTDTRAAQEDYIRERVIEGLEKKETANEIARELARATGDWSRNFGRIVETISHRAFNEGRAAMVERKGKSQVYFDVYPGACRHCIRLYLTGGINSEPIVFDVAELRANGTNYGRKSNDWKAVLGGIHPHCRCTVNEYEGGEWDPQLRTFVEAEKKIVGREPISIKFNGKEYLV